ncbi:hypothetical protein BFJ72_g5690 [Fusarium proliferatum]|uniref:Uncharacterized protein n=1 Tax=Gibberella intermedia TaxID=948311 RepID=A0A420TI75_GIBIN|nr:hypothetical protein BFJ72_g5690 [Fusarium proliferatum]
MRVGLFLSERRITTYSPSPALLFIHTAIQVLVQVHPGNKLITRLQFQILFTSHQKSAHRRSRTENYQSEATARPKKRKTEEEPQDNSIAKSEAIEGRVHVVEVQNKTLRAENKLLKDTVVDLRNSIESKDMLIKDLRQSRDNLERLLDAAEKEHKRLREN